MLSSSEDGRTHCGSSSSAMNDETLQQAKGDAHRFGRDAPSDVPLFMQDFIELVIGPPAGEEGEEVVPELMQRHAIADKMGGA